MSAPPKVFISATSGDLRSVRQIVKEALLTINCHPVEQTNFEPDWRTVEGMLKAKIEGCQALIHIVGMRYGAEPDAASLPPGTPRRSYTQMEYAIGCQLHEQRGDDGFRVYTFICPEDFPYDTGADPEPADKAQLQREHRARLIDIPRLYEKPSTADDIHARILVLQEQVLALLQQQAEVKHEVRRSHRTLLFMLGLLLVLGVGMVAFHRSTQQGIAEIKNGQNFTTEHIRVQLQESSEARYKEDLAEAAKAAPSDREKLRDAADAAHKGRTARIGDIALGFATLMGQADASDQMRRMTAILKDEGVDPALRYVKGQRDALLAADAATEASHHEQRRIRLQPLLQAADLLWTKGQTAAALADYQQLLNRDPFWPEALLALARMYGEQRLDFWTWGPRKDLKTTLAEAEEAIAFAEKLPDQGNGQVTGRNLVLANALMWSSDLLKQLGQPGDQKLALAHITRSSTLAEAYLQANPGSSQATRDVSICQQKLGDFLAKRSQPGDSATALKRYTRSLELAAKLLAASPDSSDAARDVSVSLDRLGDLLVQRSQPGDAEAALQHFTRSLELAEKLLAANPKSIQAARDVSVSHEKLGDFLARRGKPGDTAAALQHHTKSLEQREKLLAANPDSVQANHNVSVSLGRLGNLLMKRGQPGDAETALKYDTRSLELAEKQLAANPDSTQAARDVSISLYRLGDFLSQRGQPGDTETAFKHLTRSLELCEKLLAADPDSAQAQRDLWANLNKLGDLLVQRSQPSDARRRSSTSPVVWS